MPLLGTVAFLGAVLLGRSLGSAPRCRLSSSFEFLHREGVFQAFLQQSAPLSRAFQEKLRVGPLLHAVIPWGPSCPQRQRQHSPTRLGALPWELTPEVLPILSHLVSDASFPCGFIVTYDLRL